eukprot:PLAT6584.1.p1 GENE.PLAT6584.1~~PLAT6584.1.p1  ORF type:complete len:248 (+),score=69.27 PLAT6584.1:46-744(+)
MAADEPDRVDVKVSLSEAVANGQMTVARFLIEEGGVSPDEAGADGTRPLCAAALWGNADTLSFLLEAGADVNARNIGGTEWTALHAAAFQEHGKVCMFLLEAGADPLAEDAKGVRPVDYATISESIWPFFAVRGCERSLKADLVEKGVIRKIEGPSTPRRALASMSRPGSSYMRSSPSPSMFGGGSASAAAVERHTSEVDPLAEEDDEYDDDDAGGKRRGGLRRGHSLRGLI